jgi:hypothetical protein
MNPLATQKPVIGAGDVSHDSPKVHLLGVKHEMGEKGGNIRRKKNFLSCFTPSPTPSRFRVYARDGGERVNLGNLVRRPLGDLRADVRQVGPRWRRPAPWPHRSPCAPPDAPRGHRVAHGPSATLAERKTSGALVHGSFPAEILR